MMSRAEAQALVQELSPERLGAVVVEQAQRVFDSSLVALWVYHEGASELRLLEEWRRRLRASN